MTGTYPQRFRETEPVNRRIGRPLRRLIRLHDPDPALLDTIGRRLHARDEPGAALARAITSRNPDDPDKVSMAQFTQALTEGIERVPDAARPLRDFFSAVDTVPDWVDFDLVNDGGRVFRRFGRNAADVLLQLSLIGSYRFGGAADVLVQTGALTGSRTRRRLAETQHWATTISGHDAMRRTGAGFRLTVHVRLMHALVNYRFETRGEWDTGRWGLPINRSDLAATLGLFNAVPLLGVRLLGVRVTRAESRAVMHMWRYVGWLLGIDEDWLHHSERGQHRLNYHLLLTQSYGGPSGPPLARAAVDAQRSLHFRRFARQRGTYARERLLSMLGYFIGRKGVHDLELPYRLPWAIPPLLALNFLRYHVLGRSAAGRRYLERRGDRSFRRILHQYFGDDLPEVAELR
ncbi:oxygenase MpaB family protein [Actinophytocola oryzae]|uniref:Uncharacterized protein DUF2236 n=1 Tax=Actinophytocola oryzae TaxID=502181 RepID=A0A4R7UWY8_9PSEU|nr:oxygenase MpaB family protein [Actinophytocola oryzae]TDV41318.1 uncharacterized protein DUF2236 [Actinophytocola oryzae]